MTRPARRGKELRDIYRVQERRGSGVIDERKEEGRERSTGEEMTSYC
jgi:hypothetical protein